MDARVKLATSDAERWAYIATSLESTAERNAETAVILERLTARLDANDRRISALEEHRDRQIERDLSHLRDEREAREAREESAERSDAPPPATSTTLATVLNRIYNDARLIFLIGAGGASALIALLSHIGLYWR